MPKFHNQHTESQNPGGNGGRFLTVLLLIVVLLFGLRSAWQPKSSILTSASQTQSQMAHAETAKASASIDKGQPVTFVENFGWLTFIAQPLYLALRFLHDHGIGNWGWSIIVLTVIFNLLIIWPRMMSMKSSLKMMRVQPKVDALKKRYEHLKMNDPKRAEMNAEMMDLYRAEGANMFGGCVPLLLQMPLLFAYMRVLRNASELHHAHWLWLADLSSPDPLHILPLLIIGSMILTQYITPAPRMSPSQRRTLAILMPAMIGLSLWRYASGLSLYWVTGNIINLMIQLAINCTELGKEMHTLTAARPKLTP